MKKKFAAFAVIAAILMLIAACGGEKYKPHAINEETDVCEICKMAIKDDQYATQIVTKDGRSLKFDDIGCLNTWKTENGTDTIGAAFVRDYNSQQWLRYEKAYYAYDASYKTPMAYGIVSFEKEADAEAFIADQGTGTLMTADQLANHTWEVNRDMMDMGGHGHDHSSDDGHGHDDSSHDGHGETQEENHGEEGANHGHGEASNGSHDETSGHGGSNDGAHGTEASNHADASAGDHSSEDAEGHAGEGQDAAESGGHGS